MLFCGRAEMHQGTIQALALRCKSYRALVLPQLICSAFLVIMAAVAIGGQMLFKRYPYPDMPAPRAAATAREYKEEA